MSKLYIELDVAVERVVRLSRQYGDLTPMTLDDEEWLRNELEQGCEIRSCDMCRGRAYTDKPFKVTTQLGNAVEAVFNFCPVCGRDLRPIATDILGDGYV